MVWSLLGPDQERDDVTHDVFLQIFQGLPSLRDPERIEQWAARITINTINNTLRRRRYRRTKSWDPQLDPDVLVGHTDFESRNVALRVAKAFAHLPKSEQALLQRRWFESSTIDQIAVDSACSPRTVKRRIIRAAGRFERFVRKDAEVASWLEGHDAAPSDDDDDD
jgi:RNA polymerase sigma factor (sigma-70 family)